MINKLINEKAIIINLKATTKSDALKEIALHLEINKFVTSADSFEKGLVARETIDSTGIGDGIAIPHAQDESVVENVILIAKSEAGLNWESIDGKKVHYIFSIAINSKDAKKQIDALQSLSIALMNKKTQENLAKAKTENDLFNSLVVEKAVFPKKTKLQDKKVVAVTACPTGIAHTYMSAEKIEAAAIELGYNVKVETQGRKIENKLTKSDIDSADIIILAIDKAIDGMERFNGKKVIKVSTKAAIKNPEKLLNMEGKVLKYSSVSSSEQGYSDDYSWSAFKDVYKNLMGGVSRMLPFVVAGGILIGIAFLIDSGITGGNLGVTSDAAGWFAGLGKIAFGIFVPILGAYTAYSIVGPEGLLPGMIAGLIASGGGLLYGSNANVVGWENLWGKLTPGVDQGVLSSGSGFLGAMFGGYAAGFSVVLLRKTIFKKVNKIFRGIVDIVAMPLLTVVVVGGIMFGFQIPLAYLAHYIKEGLEYINNKNLIIVLSMLLGAMMAFDMGGPVNKVAYVFATAGLTGNPTSSQLIIMASVMVSGMVPPIGIALSNIIFRKKAWSQKDISASSANWLLGLFFITEGAIPFAAKDPKRTIPSLIVGSMIAGIMIGALKVGVGAPHGGIIVAALFKSTLMSDWSSGMQNIMGVSLMIISLIIGSLSTALMLGFWRMRDVKKGKLKLI